MLLTDSSSAANNEKKPQAGTNAQVAAGIGIPLGWMDAADLVMTPLSTGTKRHNEIIASGGTLSCSELDLIGIMTVVNR
jgi:hypothetical protein